MFVGAAVWFGILSGSVQLAIYLQTVRGLDALAAVLVLTPWPLAAAVLFPRTRPASRRGSSTARDRVGSSLGVAVPAAAFDLALAATLGGDDVLAGPTSAFASRAIAFGLVLALVAPILPRGHAVAMPKPA